MSAIGPLMRLTGGWIGITSLSDERRAINGLEFASRCGVHPAWLQDDYSAFFLGTGNMGIMGNKLLGTT